MMLCSACCQMLCHHLVLGIGLVGCALWLPWGIVVYRLCMCRCSLQERGVALCGLVALPNSCCVLFIVAFPSRSKAPLTAFLESADSLNQRSMVGLCKFFIRIRPATSPTACAIMVDFMQFIVRLGLQESYKKELVHLRGHFDECMVYCLASMKKDGLALKAFWQKHRKIAGMLVPPAAVDRILCEEGSWSAVSSELTLVSQSCRLGEKMFGFAAAYVWAGKLKDVVEHELAQLPGHITMGVINDFVAKCKVTVQEQLGALCAKQVEKRVIQLTFKQMPIEVTVNSTHEDIVCRLHCRIKGSCGGKGMPFLPFEEDIWPDGGGVPEHTAASEVVADTKMARETFTAMVGDMKGTAALAKQLLASKATLLHQLDKNWKIEDWGPMQRP
jgi:hypothetical protein